NIQSNHKTVVRNTMQQQPVDELPGYRYDPIKRRYFRLETPGSAPSNYDRAYRSDTEPKQVSTASLKSVCLTRYLFSRSLGPTKTSAQQSPSSVIAQCRLSVCPPPSRCQQSCHGPPAIVRRPTRLVSNLFRNFTNSSSSKRFDSIYIGVHTGCSVDGIPGVSSGGLLEESRRFGLRIRRNRQQKINKTLKFKPLSQDAQRRIFELPAPAAFPTSVAFDLVKAPTCIADCDTLTVAAFANCANSNNGSIQLSVLARKATVNPNADADDASNNGTSLISSHSFTSNVGIRWPSSSRSFKRKGFSVVDQGDQLVDLRISPGVVDFQTALAGRHAVFCLPSVNSLRSAASSIVLSPLCTARSPIVNLDATLLASNSRLLAVCSLNDLLLADARASTVAVSIRRQCRHNFTACKFLVSDSNFDPRVIVADSPGACLLFDIRNPSKTLAVLSPCQIDGDNRDDVGLGHRASWLQTDSRCDLVARTDPRGLATVWYVNSGRCCENKENISPLLTIPAPSIGGLTLPVLVDSDDTGNMMPAGLAALELTGEADCDLAFWPIAF
ncbi:hypothetical protein BOX15_Mlig033390g1, partial [Macrostomum lignano]